MVLEINITRTIGSLPPDEFSSMRAMGAEMSIIWVTYFALIVPLLIVYYWIHCLSNGIDEAYSYCAI